MRGALTLEAVRDLVSDDLEPDLRSLGVQLDAECSRHL
jgi:hypothetical protein